MVRGQPPLPVIACTHPYRSHRGQALLAVNLDVDEIIVHEAGNTWSLTTLVHDMAPVAGRISYAEEDRFIFAHARPKASSPQGYQSTGLCACWSK